MRALLVASAFTSFAARVMPGSCAPSNRGATSSLASA